VFISKTVIYRRNLLTFHQKLSKKNKFIKIGWKINIIYYCLNTTLNKIKLHDSAVCEACPYDATESLQH
jgi:hypothetical protein